MEIKGKVSEVMSQESGEGKTGKSWKRQSFVLTFIDGNYEKNLFMTAKNEKAVEMVSALKSGQEVKVHFNAESRSWNDKWFTDLVVWKIETNEKQDLPF